MTSGAPTMAGKLQTKCPVEGDAINRAIYTDYKGKRVYFCCDMCPPKFKADTEKYMAEMARAGVVLEDAPAHPGAK